MSKTTEQFSKTFPREKIVAFCKKWNIQELSFFGSVVNGGFGPESDIDVLVKYAADAKRSFLRRVEAQDELKEILGRPVDLVSKVAVEKSHNELRRKEILDGAQVYYSDEKAA